MIKQRLLAILLFTLGLYVIAQTNDLTDKASFTKDNISWTAVLSGEAIAKPVRTSNGFAVIQDGRMVSSFTDNGYILWQKGISGTPLPILSVSDNDFLYTVTSRTNLTILNPSGIVLWKAELPFEATQDIYLDEDGRAFVRNSTNICCVGINGIIKWNVSTSNMSDIPIQQFNDDTLLVFLKDLKDGKSKGLHISKYGEIIEEIVFTGIVTNAFSCDSGVLLTISDGSLALCSVSKNVTDTKWVINSKSIRTSKDSIFRSIDKNQYAVITPSSSGAVTYLVDVVKGSVIQSFNLPEIRDIPLVFESSFDRIVCADKNVATVYSMSGNMETAVNMPNFAWTYVIYSKNGYLIFSTNSWTLNAYRLLQIPQSNVQRKENKKNDSISNQNPFGITNELSSFQHKIELENGMYGAKEKKWFYQGSAIINLYTEYKNGTDFGYTPDTVKNIADMNALFTSLSMYGCEPYFRYTADLINLETDTSLLIALFASVKKCGYDPDSEIMNAIEVKMKNTSPNQTLLLKEMCSSIYEICRFMGRPALNKKGRALLSTLFLPQYSEEIKNEARSAFMKIIDLKM